MKIAVITPYYKENTEMLKKCHDSVMAQTYSVTHYMVSDGFENPEVKNWNIKHISLPNHGDFGDTPRALGSYSAISHGHDAVLWLDGDNYYEPNHVETLMKIHNETKAPIVTATRNIVDKNYKLMGVCNESDGNNFNDSNCYFVAREAYHLIHCWLLKDSTKGIVGDRIFWQNVIHSKIKRSHCSIPTINYLSTLAFHYNMFGLTPPDDSKVIARFPNEENHRTISYAEFKKLTGKV